MSVFFGIFNRNGNPIDKKIADDMLKSMSSWSPDEHDLWLKDSVCLGHAMLWNTPESKYEHIPLQKNAYVLSMDARIDNRKELVNELDLPFRPLEEIGDSEFILAAYEKWGEECTKHLLGDFSFAIWDEKKEQLFCVRDHIGIKPFFYFESNELFVFSNDISVLLKHSQISKSLDDYTVAYFVKDQGIHSKYATFFDKIKKLPPATSMVINEKEIKTKTYWRIEETSVIRYDSFQEYTKKLRELFNDAVEVRMRTNFPMVSHLSGGIDSSSIAVQAARKLKEKRGLLHVFNWIDIPQEKDLYEYESWSFSRRIAEKEENIIHEEFYLDPTYIAKQYVTHDIFTQGTMYYWGEYYIQEKMKEIDARVILSGWGGDELITYNGYSFISGLFRQGKILTALYLFIREKKYHQNLDIRLIKSILKVILPSKLFIALRKIIKSNSEVEKKCDYDNYQYLADTFAKFTKSQQDVEYPRIKGVRNRQLALYNWGHIHQRIESWFLSSISKRMEYRYPLLDKRIVEFAIGIPEELFYPRKGKERVLFKTAIRDLIPSDILWFNKPHEVKVNKANREKIQLSIKLLKEMLYNKKQEYSGYKYYNYHKIYNSLAVNNKCESASIVGAILFLFAKVRLDKEHFKEDINEEDMEETNY